MIASKTDIIVGFDVCDVGFVLGGVWFDRIIFRKMVSGSM